MTIAVSGTQRGRLNRGTIDPIFLLDIVPSSGTGSPLRFCTKRSVVYNGETYQPYLQAVSNSATQADYPENNSGNTEYRVDIENAPIAINGITYPYVSHTFDVTAWELADADLKAR